MGMWSRLWAAAGAVTSAADSAKANGTDRVWSLVLVRVMVSSKGGRLRKTVKRMGFAAGQSVAGL